MQITWINDLAYVKWTMLALDNNYATHSASVQILLQTASKIVCTKRFQKSKLSKISSALIPYQKSSTLNSCKQACLALCHVRTDSMVLSYEAFYVCSVTAPYRVRGPPGCGSRNWSLWAIMRIQITCLCLLRWNLWLTTTIDAQKAIATKRIQMIFGFYAVITSRTGDAV